VFVTRAESTANWDTRKQVEELVLGLARNVDRNVSIGDTTFGELATATGCTGGVEKCKGPILDSLAIDEIVSITIAPAGTDSVKVTVRRVSKSAPTREATAIAKSSDPKPAVVASIGPLFGAKKIIEPPRGAKQPTPPPSKGTVTPGGTGVVIDNEDPLKKPGPRNPSGTSRRNPSRNPADSAGEAADLPPKAESAAAPTPPSKTSRLRQSQAKPDPKRTAEAAVVADSGEHG
jgi:hypothetical protein